MNENRYTVRVESCDARDSHAWLSLGDARIAARRWPGIRRGQTAVVHVRPEEVVLCTGHPGRVSARNVLPGHVQSLRHRPDGVRVTVAVGFPLTALLTRAAVQELRLRRGSPVFAIVKASLVAPDVPLVARFRVSLVGRGGILGHDKLDFLRAVEREGSLSAAARRLGVTYRTAWAWARACERLWGAPLLAPAHGGRGGGGSSLTPEGAAVLALAARLESAPAE